MLTFHGFFGLVVLQSGDLLLAKRLGCRLGEVHRRLLLGGEAWLHDVWHQLGLASKLGVETIVICHLLDLNYIRRCKKYYYKWIL